MSKPPTLNVPSSLAKLASDRLDGYASDISTDPQTNSVRRLAIDMFRWLEDGDLANADLLSLIKHLSAETLVARANTLKERRTMAGGAQADQVLKDRLYQLANDGFDAFKETVERLGAGIVFTAHPTFGMSPAAYEALASAALADGPNVKPIHDLIGQGFQSGEDITLQAEHDQVQNAILNGQSALAELWNISLDVAQERFPNDWFKLSPSMINLASWVGYDLDGRTDIHWSATLSFRLREKAIQLQRYSDTLTDLSSDLSDLFPIAQRLAAAAAHSKQSAERFSADLTKPQKLVEAANFLTADHADKLISLGEVVRDISHLAHDSVKPEQARKLMVLASQMRTFGLGTSCIHLRINAAQVSAVLRHDLNIESHEDDFGRVALAQITKLAENASVCRVNFADMFQEQMTARRQFMLCAQLLKHVDQDAPIRFLIAESENPVTIMGALYLARLYGVADKVDLSPLFETPDALESGGRFVERLLESDDFKDYVNNRGRLCLQFGFSDSGRFSSQPAGDMAIERIHNLVINALSDSSLDQIDLLLFNTHGESMGRGAYPGDMTLRLNHLLTPYTRHQMAKNDIGCIHEFSFQGGDGFLHFLTPEMARTTVLQAACVLLDIHGSAEEDSFYARRDVSWDVYRSIRTWHEGLFENPDYPKALLEFAPGFLFKTGSRQSRRQTGASAGELGLRSLRAIPHNAILQQLALPLNVACGFGSAAGAEPDRLADLIRTSPRLKTLVAMSVKSREVTSVPAFRAYANLFDPGFWIAIAKRSDRATAQVYRRLALLFSNYETHSAMLKLGNIVTIDLARFDRILAQFEDAPSAEDRHKSRSTLHILHATRQALMMRAFVLAAQLPEFSQRHGGASADDLLKQVTQMQISNAAEMIKTIFPAQAGRDDELDRLTEPTDRCGADSTEGYAHIHEHIVSPLLEIEDAIHESTIAIANVYGAFG